MILSHLICPIRSNAEVIATVPRRNKMYVLDCSPAKSYNICEETNQEQKRSDGSGEADL